MSITMISDMIKNTVLVGLLVGGYVQAASIRDLFQAKYESRGFSPREPIGVGVGGEMRERNSRRDSDDMPRSRRPYEQYERPSGAQGGGSNINIIVGEEAADTIVRSWSDAQERIADI